MQVKHARTALRTAIKARRMWYEVYRLTIQQNGDSVMLCAVMDAGVAIKTTIRRLVAIVPNSEFVLLNADERREILGIVPARELTDTIVTVSNAISHQTNKIIFDRKQLASGEREETV